MEWSEKAVELGNDSTSPETLVQLKNELESYRQKKPWRELQEVTAEPTDSETDEEDENEQVDSDEESSIATAEFVGHQVPSTAQLLAEEEVEEGGSVNSISEEEEGG